jgi:hypothetical protein
MQVVYSSVAASSATLDAPSSPSNKAPLQLESLESRLMRRASSQPAIAHAAQQQLAQMPASQSSIDLSWSGRSTSPQASPTHDEPALAGASGDAPAFVYNENVHLASLLARTSLSARAAVLSSLVRAAAPPVFAAAAGGDAVRA